jgi:protein SCO1/2
MALCLAVGLMLGSREALAQRLSPMSDVLKKVGIDQKLDAQVPLDLEFVDENGVSAPLSKYFGQRPVVLTLVQYRCPRLCTQVLSGFLKVSQALPQTIGKDYDVLTVSFDDRETPALAAEKKAACVQQYRRAGAETGWHFLTGSKASIERLTEAAGFRYFYDEPKDQFAHASAIMILTPDGRMSRYFYGIEYFPRDVRLGLVDSSAGKIGSPVDQILLLCYHYDPLTGKYGLAISWTLKVAGLATFGALAAFLWVSFRREMRMPRLTAAVEQR